MFWQLFFKLHKGTLSRTGMLLKDAYFWNTALRNNYVFSGNLLLSLNLFTTSRDYHYVVNWCISDLTFTTLSKFSVSTSNTFVLCLLFYCKHTSVYLYDLCNRLSFPVQVAYLSINKTICQKHDRWVLWLPHTCLGGDEGPVLHTHDFEKVSTLQMLKHLMSFLAPETLTCSVT